MATCLLSGGVDSGHATTAVGPTKVPKPTVATVLAMVKHVGPYHKKRDIHTTSGFVKRNDFVEHGKCSKAHPLNPNCHYYRVTRKLFTFKDCADGNRLYKRVNTAQKPKYMFGYQLHRIGTTVAVGLDITSGTYGKTLEVTANKHTAVVTYADIDTSGGVETITLRVHKKAAITYYPPPSSVPS
jgi:hypothetical protein